MLINIYALVNPIDDSIFYIGATMYDIKVRFAKHMSNQNSNKKKWALLKVISERGLRPTIELLDIVHVDDSTFYEQFYCDLYRSWGFDLCNKHKSQYRLYAEHRVDRLEMIAALGLNN